MKVFNFGSSNHHMISKFHSTHVMNANGSTPLPPPLNILPRSPHRHRLPRPTFRTPQTKPKIQLPHQPPNTLQQPIHIPHNTRSANLHDSKRRIIRFVQMPHSKDVAIEPLQRLGEVIRLRRVQVGRERRAVIDGSGEEGEQDGDFDVG